MVFSSILFLYYFLTVVLIGYYLAPRKWRNLFFLAVSLFFYAWGEPSFIFILLGSIVFNYLTGLVIDRSSKKKRWIFIGCAGNLLLLGVFKYLNFFADNLNAVFPLHFEIPVIALPLGISFFTFQAMSYIIDVYRKDAPVQKNVLNLAMYITAFPQLVAGPIVRYTTIMKQISDRTCTPRKTADGVVRFVTGMSKKVILSNPLGLLADELFLDSSFSFTAATAWIGIAAYTLQIYFDFSGYSDMAIGLGKMFGFEFEENFRYPYISKSITEFWRRWHISLSSFFRDYVYIPLGGSRVPAWRHLLNLLIVWFLTGMWHGAEWTFIVWGLYYGALLILEKYVLLPDSGQLPPVIDHIYTMFFVMIGWVFFRAATIGDALRYLAVMFGLSGNGWWDTQSALLLHDNRLLFVLAIAGAAPFVNKQAKKLFCFEAEDRPLLAVLCISAGSLLLLCLCTVCLANSTYNPFIYFRF